MDAWLSIIARCIGNFTATDRAPRSARGGVGILRGRRLRSLAGVAAEFGRISVALNA